MITPEVEVLQHAHRTTIGHANPRPEEDVKHPIVEGSRNRMAPLVSPIPRSANGQVEAIHQGLKLVAARGGKGGLDDRPVDIRV